MIVKVSTEHSHGTSCQTYVWSSTRILFPLTNTMCPTGESSSHQHKSAKCKRSAVTPCGPHPAELVNSPPKQSKNELAVIEAICNAVHQYASCIAQPVKDIYTDQQKGEHPEVIFTIIHANLPQRKYVSSRSYVGNPWFTGRLVLPPSTDSTELYEAHLLSFSAATFQVSSNHNTTFIPQCIISISISYQSSTFSPKAGSG